MNVIKYMFTGAVIMALAACQQSVPKRLESPKNNAVSLQKMAVINQTQLNALADQLEVKYRFLSNVETDCPDAVTAGVEHKLKTVSHCYGAEIRLTAPQNYRASNWIINFSQVYPVYASRSEEFNLQHINGDIHQITPTENFTGFDAGETKVIKLWVQSTLITESELMPNYWLSSIGLQPKIIASTRTIIDSATGLELQPYVVPFTDFPKQIQSSPEDINQYASSPWLFDHELPIDNIAREKSRLTDEELATAIIPTPKFLQIIDKDAQLNLASGIYVQLKGIEKSEVSAALARLALLGVKQVTRVNKPEAVAINITVNSALKSASYQLVIGKSSIDIHAQDSDSAFYALQSLASLVTLGKQTLPLVKVVDQPAYAYRGQHIDVARNFHSKEMILTLIKQMAAYKLNKLHLHLAEDEAWRLQLPSFPELTDIPMIIENTLFSNKTVDF